MAPSPLLASAAAAADDPPVTTQIVDLANMLNDQRQAVRYLLVPEKLVHLTEEDAARQPSDFLSDDLTRRIAKSPWSFT